MARTVLMGVLFRGACQSTFVSSNEHVVGVILVEKLDLGDVE